MVDARNLPAKKRVWEKEKVRPTFVMLFALAFRNDYCTRIASVKKL